jgi:hypothetical protein
VCAILCYKRPKEMLLAQKQGLCAMSAPRRTLAPVAVLNKHIATGLPVGLGLYRILLQRCRQGGLLSIK